MLMLLWLENDWELKVAYLLKYAILSKTTTTFCTIINATIHYIINDIMKGQRGNNMAVVTILMIYAINHKVWWLLYSLCNKGSCGSASQSFKRQNQKNSIGVDKPMIDYDASIEDAIHTFVSKNSIWKGMLKARWLKMSHNQ